MDARTRAGELHTLNLGTLQKTVYLVVDIFAVLVTVVLGLVHKPSTFSPMANLFPGFSSLQQVQLHSGRNCLNLFQTTAQRMQTQ